MEIPLLRDLVIIFSLSVVVIYGCRQVNLPILVGLLVTGMLVGPRSFGLIHEVHLVEVMAEIGVILLLFSIGIEFSLKKLWQIRTLVLIGGTLQVGLTMLGTFAVTHYLLGWATTQAWFLGMLLSLSSTAIVLKLYQERGEMETMQGRLALGVLIFQDIAAVLMILVTPMLGGEVLDTSSLDVFRLVLIGLGLPLFIWLGSQYVLPWMLHRVVSTRSPELFLLSIVSICFAVAWGFSQVGISLALGAFLAGLVISESEYSHEAFEHVLPFREIFTSIFFVSAGMLLDIGYLWEHLVLVLAVLLAVLVFKLFILLGVAIVLGMPLRTAWIAGFSLCQVGEFAFVLNTTGSRFQLLSPDNEQLFLTVIVLTMMLTSFLIAGAPQLTQSLLHLPWPRRLRAGLYKGLRLQIRSSRYDLQDHLVIVGYGINGRNVARAAKRAQVPYVVLETNPDTVRSEQALGEPLVYGDATQKAVLNRVGIRQARTVVVVIAEATATRRIVSAVRELNPSVYLIARTRYVREVEELRRLGANEVVPEEFETALEIFDRVLTQYLVPRPEIDHLVEEMRSGNYDLLRQEALPETTEISQEPNLHPEIQVTTLLLDATCSWTGQSLQKIHLRAEHGVSLVALRRQGKMLLDLSGETILQADDELFLIGPPEKMRQVAQLLRIEVV